MDTTSHFTGRCSRLFNGRKFTAEVTVMATPIVGRESSVTLSDSVVNEMQEVFGADTEFLERSCLRASLLVQIASANVSGEMPLVAKAIFAITVVSLHVSGHANREMSGFLISVASMEAMGNYLEEFERQCMANEG